LTVYSGSILYNAKHVFAPGQLDVAGTYYLEVELIDASGGQITSPTIGAIHLVVTDDVG
jgi:hypothetical protein